MTAFYVGQRVIYRDEISDPNNPAVDVQDDSDVVTFVRADGTRGNVSPVRTLGPSIADPSVQRYGYEAAIVLDAPGQWTIYGKSTGNGSGVSVQVVSVVALP